MVLRAGLPKGGCTEVGVGAVCCNCESSVQSGLRAVFRAVFRGKSRAVWCNCCGYGRCRGCVV
jgi:hypothetical protein